MKKCHFGQCVPLPRPTRSHTIGIVVSCGTVSLKWGLSSSGSNCHLHSPHKWQTTQYGQHPPTTGSCKLAPAKKAHKINWNKRRDRSCHLQMSTSWRNHSEKSSLQLHPTFESPVCGWITPTTLDIILARYFLLDALYLVMAHFSIFLATGLNSFCQFPWFWHTV